MEENVMGEKDITEKMLADYNDVFADIVNVLMFKGKRVIDEFALENIKDKSQFKINKQIHEEERDIAKIIKGQNIRIALLGLEHQTDIDEDEVFRVIAYDGVSYKSELLNNRKERYPVITLVLYFGEKRWNKAKSLYEALDIKDEWKPYVNDYKINLFEISYLEPEQIQMFESDFKIVADYFVQMRINKNYVPSKETINHVDAVLKLMYVLTGNAEFEEMQNYQIEGGITNMYKTVGMFRAQGMIEAYYSMNVPVEDIAKKMNMDENEVKKIIDVLKLNKKEPPA